MERWERVKYVMEYFNLNKNSFSKEIGLSTNTTIGRLLNEKRNPSDSTLKKISERFDVNIDWLKIGAGNMLNNSTNKNMNPTNKNSLKNINSNSFIQLDSNCFLMKIPLLEIEDQATFINKHQEEDFLNKIENFHSIIVNNIHEEKYIAFRVKGDSMDNGKSDNGIISNSIVSCRELQKNYWKSELKIKKFPFWMIATTQNPFPLLKQITGHNTKKGTIICHSLNESIEYRDFELNLNDVIGLYYVIDVQKNIADIEY